MFSAFFGSDSNRLPALGPGATDFEKSLRKLNPVMWKIDPSAPKAVAVMRSNSAQFIGIKNAQTLRLLEELGDLEVDTVAKLHSELGKLLPVDYIQTNTTLLFIWAYVRLRTFRVLFFKFFGNDESQTTLMLNLVFAAVAKQKWGDKFSLYLDLLLEACKSLTDCSIENDTLRLMQIIWAGVDRKFNTQEDIYTDKDVYTCQVLLEMTIHAHDLALSCFASGSVPTRGSMGLNFATAKYYFSCSLRQIQSDYTADKVRALFTMLSSEKDLQRQFVANMRG